MIPLHQDERIEYVDEKDKMRYFIRALTGQNEAKYTAIVERYSSTAPLEVIINVEDELVDFVVLGWESLDGRKVSAFPQDGKPAKCFGRADKNKFIDIAMRVNHLTDAEVKN